MVWVDKSNRGSGGAPQVGQATIDGQQWTLYQNGSGELIWSLGAPGTFAQQGSGTVDLLALLRWLPGERAHGRRRRDRDDRVRVGDLFHRRGEQDLYREQLRLEEHCMTSGCTG